MSKMSMLVDIEALIVEVKCRPPLYDLSHREYHSRGVKKQLWEEVCSSLKTPQVWNSMKMKHKMQFEREVWKKWNSLRTCFRRELRLNILQNDGAMEKKRKKYMYYDDLQFLLPFTKLHQSESTLENDEARESAWLDILSDEDITDTKSSKEAENVTEDNYEEPLMEIATMIKSEVPCEDTRAPEPSESSDSSSSDNQTVNYFRQKKEKNPIRKRKRMTHRIDDDHQMIRKDSHLLGNRNSVPCDTDGDEAFLTSLLPSLKDFSTEEKLQLRIEIMKTILNFKKSLDRSNK